MAKNYQVAPSRVSSKQTKIIFGSNQNKPKQDLFHVCFGLFRETNNKKFRFVSVFRTYIETTETTLNFLKNTQIYSLLNCLGGSSVCFGSIETLCFGIEAKQPKHRNKLFRNKPKKPRKKPKKTEKSEKTINFL
jgi:hypothetical protein